MIGYRIRFQLSDPWKLEGLDENLCVEGVIEHFVATSGSDGQRHIAVRLDRILTYKVAEYDRLIASARYVGQSVADLIDGAEVTVGAYGVARGTDPQPILEPLAWWRGGLGVIGEATLVPRD